MSKEKRKKKLRDKQRRLRQFRERRGETALLPHTQFPKNLPPNTLIVRDPPGLARMSEVFEDFLAPEMATAESEDALRTVLKLGMIAWNASLLPPAERARMIQETASTMPADVVAAFRLLLDHLIRRKEEHFAEHLRVIFDFSLTFDANGPYLQVVSSMPNEA